MFKTKLQELCQRLALPLPEYSTTREGPPHDAKFNATVTVNGLPFHSTPSKCRTSKEAQNIAASFAYEYFSANPPEVTLPPSRPSPSDPPPARLPVHIALDQGQALPADPQPVCSPQPHHSSPLQISMDSLSGTQTVQSQLPQETITNDPSYLISPALLDGPQPHSPVPQQALIHNHSSATAEGISTAPVDVPQPHTPLLQQTQNQNHSSPQGISTGGRVLYKSKLQELCRMRAWKQPEYTTVKEGPDHMPQFTSTVIVNGVPFKTPHNQSRSSKEATSLAARVALEHLTGVKTVSQEDLYPSSADHTDVKVQNNERNAQTSNFSSTPLAGRETYKSSDVLHIYKNRLQQYAQKQGIALPEYSIETEGPPHDRLFRSKVAIAGNMYESPQFFRTLKEAEQAAAKVALEALSPIEIQKGGGLHKTLLQQLAQKLGHLFPVYKTVQCGPPHAASFMSTVQVGEETYQGHGAKSKKQAEMNAAEVAYNTLINCSDICTKRQKTSTTPGSHISCLPTPHGVSLCQ